MYIVSANRLGIPTFSAFGSEAGLHGSYNTVNQRSERNIDVGWFVCIVIVLILAGDLRSSVALCRVRVPAILFVLFHLPPLAIIYSPLKAV